MKDGNSIWFRIPFELASPNDLGCLSAISGSSEISEASTFLSEVRLSKITEVRTPEMLELKEELVRSRMSSDVLSNKVSITASPTPLITCDPTPSITTNPTPRGSPSVSLKVDSLLRGLSILVVDDAFSIVKMISFILTKAGVEVT
jgi:CheY-like chemotaxis protein